MRVDQ